MGISRILAYVVLISNPDCVTESLKMYSAAVRGRVEMRMPPRGPFDMHPGAMPPPSSGAHYPPAVSRMPPMESSSMRPMPPTQQTLPPQVTNGNGINGMMMNGNMSTPSDGQGPGFDGGCRSSVDGGAERLLTWITFAVLPTGKRPTPIDTNRPPPNNTKKSKATPSPRKTSQSKIPPNPHFTRSRRASASADA